MASSKGTISGHSHRSHKGCHNLLTSLESQLNLSFSKYDQWHRQERAARPPSLRKNKQDITTTFKVEMGNKTALFSSSRSQREQAKLVEERRIQLEAIDALELKIKQGKQTTELYTKRSKELVEINLDIAGNIESKEEETFAKVKGLLRKYERFRGSIATLNSIFAREISEVRHELQKTKEIIQRKLVILEQQVEEIDQKLIVKQDELQVLRTYKEKEYPVKTMMIAKLKGEIESIKNTNQADEEDLAHVFTTELGKRNQERILLADTITRRITEESLSLLSPSLEDMALQNLMLKKEIEIQKAQQQNLTQRTRELTQEVAELSRHPKTNLRLQLFPEVFSMREKCDPDVDLVLDIPKQKWLPI